MTDGSDASSANPITSVVEGGSGGEYGVRFTYHDDLSKLISDTAGPEGFAWKWLFMGQMRIAYNDDAREFSGTMLVGRSGSIVHGLIHPSATPNRAGYFAADIATVEVQGIGSAGLIKKRPRTVKLRVDGFLEATSIGVNEVMPHGHQSVNNKEVDFLAALAR